MIPCKFLQSPKLFKLFHKFKIESKPSKTRVLTEGLTWEALKVPLRLPFGHKQNPGNQKFPALRLAFAAQAWIFMDFYDSVQIFTTTKTFQTFQQI